MFLLPTAHLLPWNWTTRIILETGFLIVPLLEDRLPWKIWDPAHSHHHYSFPCDIEMWAASLTTLFYALEDKLLAGELNSFISDIREHNCDKNRVRALGPFDYIQCEFNCCGECAYNRQRTRCEVWHSKSSCRVDALVVGFCLRCSFLFFRELIFTGRQAVNVVCGNRNQQSLPTNHTATIHSTYFDWLPWTSSAIRTLCGKMPHCRDFWRLCLGLSFI